MGTLFDVFGKLDADKIPAKLVEPSSGKTVEFEITEDVEHFKEQYLSQLTPHKESLAKYGITWNVTGSRIRFEFPSESVAQLVRQKYKK